MSSGARIKRQTEHLSCTTKCRSLKSEIRSPKPETNPKGGKGKKCKTRQAWHCLEPSAFEFRICFGFRASDFGFLSPPGCALANGLALSQEGRDSQIGRASCRE